MVATVGQYQRWNRSIKPWETYNLVCWPGLGRSNDGEESLADSPLWTCNISAELDVRRQ